jgi:hypothetical protein
MSGTRKEMMQLKTAFIEQLKKDQYFASQFSHSFCRPVDAVNFWKFCDLHYPYEVVTTTAPTTHSIKFEEKYAMAILEDLTAPKRVHLNSYFFGVLKEDFVKALTSERFACTSVPHGFPTVDEAISFWTFCNLSYPYTLVNTTLSFRVMFEENIGSVILSDLTRSPSEKTRQMDDSEAVLTPCVFPPEVVNQTKKRPFPEKATCFFPTFQTESQPE